MCETYEGYMLKDFVVAGVHCHYRFGKERQDCAFRPW